MVLRRKGPLHSWMGGGGRPGQGRTHRAAVGDCVSRWILQDLRGSREPVTPVSYPPSSPLPLDVRILRLLIWSRFPIIFMNIKEMIVLIKLTVLSGNTNTFLYILTLGPLSYLTFSGFVS